MQGLMFKPEMTIANIEGRKSYTSRTRGLDKINENPNEWICIDMNSGVPEFHGDDVYWLFYSDKQGYLSIKCPFGQVGSELYGKETYDLLFNTQHTAVEKVIYKADYPKEALENEACDFGPWKSPMMMKEIYSRYHLILNKIVAMRLQDTTEEDCIGEGIKEIKYESKEPVITWPIGYKNYLLGDKNYVILSSPEYFKHPYPSFRSLWDMVNGNPKKGKSDYSWKANPWIWRLYYTVKLKSEV